MTVPSLLILGTDAVLAATPATPVQLAHACLAVGYQAVIPASWGDELIAARAIERLRGADAPIVQCSCPLVARRFAAHGAPIAHALFVCASPPVATAKYLRALYAPVRPYITFVGACAGADHEAIDVWLMPDALASALAERGVSVLAQPTEFDAVLPPDRRRFYSEPGGVPSRQALRELTHAVDLRELSTDDLVAELAQQLLGSAPTLLDVAPALGCICSGASQAVNPESARAGVRASEPPRALAPVVDHDVPLVLESAAPAAPEIAPAAMVTIASIMPVPPVTPSIPPAPASSFPEPVLADPVLPAPMPLAAEDFRLGEVVAETSPVALEQMPRQTPTVPQRAVLGSMPHTRTEMGRQLPRAYVARRRSTPRNVARASTSVRARQSGLRAFAPVRWVGGVIALLGAGLIAAWLAQRP